MEQVIVQVTREALVLVLVLSAPPLFTALFIGFVVGLIQAATQLQEQTLVYVPKIVGVFLVLMALLPWMIAQAVRFGRSVIAAFPQWIE